MRGQTMAEKILSHHSGQEVWAGDLTIVNVDQVMASDTTAPLTIKAFQEMNGEQVWDSEKIVFVIDHAAPSPNERISNLHTMMREFAKDQNIKLYDVGEGICHQLMIENNHVQPGDLVLGADSHTCTYGAIGAFSSGIGSTDLAGILLTGKTWLKVPETLKVTLHGEMPAGVTSKDIILSLSGILGINGATYQAIEFTGEALDGISRDGRLTLSNMVVEIGAKAGLIPTEDSFPDENAKYSREIEINVSELEPQIACPHSPDNIKGISLLEDIKIDYAFLGSCTNGRLEDLHTAAEVLKGKKIADGVRMLITPASKKVYQHAILDGTAMILMEAGATITSSGCGACVGTHMGIPGNGETVISSTNRNFQGRMGNKNASIYLGSPAVVAASALYGTLTDPRKIREVNAK
ncbi:3-isopropylmalate dehydratase large subunit [Fictibacillus enclensis]|uniref:3-isopropylmalate dehydratase large subunit n=1 Tax=Fictibacillus enclensis TaxID=1017270 RepID=UPI0025A13163|nr:3-isopropylmalate dehydratase large subunit [Fictibacillus enclensis]MDM5336624.1 3-isopropylmalate dehydratase large subunit [Fictibacillus enclensis]